MSAILNWVFCCVKCIFATATKKRACIVGQNQSALDLMKSVSAVQADVPYEFSETCELDKSKVLLSVTITQTLPVLFTVNSLNARASSAV